MASHALLQPQIQHLQQLAVFVALSFGDAGAQRSGLAAAAGQRQIFFNLHGGGSAGHRVLEHAADVLGPLVLRQAGDINAVNDDLAAVHRPDTGHCV